MTILYHRSSLFIKILDMSIHKYHLFFIFQEINFLREGAVLHYGQKVENCTLERLWNELKLSCDFSNACKEVEKFNLGNRWKKRGIAMIPTKFGISFTTKFMNQVTF